MIHINLNIFYTHVEHKTLHKVLYGKTNKHTRLLLLGFCVGLLSLGGLFVCLFYFCFSCLFWFGMVSGFLFVCLFVFDLIISMR